MLPEIILDKVSTPNGGSFGDAPKARQGNVVRKLCGVFVFWLVVAVICMYVLSPWDWNVHQIVSKRLVEPPYTSSYQGRSLPDRTSETEIVTALPGALPMTATGAGKNILNGPSEKSHGSTFRTLFIESLLVRFKGRVRQSSSSSRPNFVATVTPPATHPSPTVNARSSNALPQGIYTSTISSSLRTSSQPISAKISSSKTSADPVLPSGQKVPSTDTPVSLSDMVMDDGTPNSTSVVCKLPHLLIDDLSISQYLKTYKPLKCAQMANWVYTHGGHMYISSDATKKYGRIACDYYDIYRKDDNHWDWRIHRKVVNGTQVMGDAFQVVCNSSSGKKYKNLHLGVPNRPDLIKRKPSPDFAKKASKPLGWNVLIYLMDSLSRVNFLRKLPKLSETLSSQMGAIIMEGFNIVGDGTPWTMIPVTTGHFQTELYEARKRFNNASHLDDWPLIFKDFKQAGYVTSYAEEQPQFSFYSYKLKGFKEPPVDHYLRMFEQAVNYVKYRHRSYCLGDKPRSIMLNHWWREFQDMYRPHHQVKTFSILFSSETSHDDYNSVEYLDEHWEKVFREQFEAGYFNDTFLVVMGDHGRRFGPIRTTQTGKTEEKLPFLALVVPPSFKEEHPKCWQNLLTNVNRLVTPFDLYETLQAILHFDPKISCALGNISHRGMPLFQEIPPARSCRDAWIKPHFCSCLEWEPIPNELDAQEAADFVLKEFNKMTAVAGGLCAPLRLGRIVWSRQLHPNHNLMAFKESQDYDNIFPDLTSNANLTSILYQIRLTTLPNNADYEVSVTHYVDLNSYAFSYDEVSRLDMYGDQPHCIMNTHHQLRQYCICKDKVSNTSGNVTA